MRGLSRTHNKNSLNPTIDTVALQTIISTIKRLAETIARHLAFSDGNKRAAILI
jgi:prophage maintenance system killer protein